MFKEPPPTEINSIDSIECPVRHRAAAPRHAEAACIRATAGMLTTGRLGSVISDISLLLIAVFRWIGTASFSAIFFRSLSHSCTRLARRSAPQNSTNPFDSFGIATAPLSTFSKHPVFPEILIFGRSRPSDPFSLHLRLTLGFFHSGILSTLSGDCVLCIEFLQYWCVAFHNEIMGHVFFLSSSSVASSCVHGVGVK